MNSLAQRIRLESFAVFALTGVGSAVTLSSIFFTWLTYQPIVCFILCGPSNNTINLNLVQILDPSFRDSFPANSSISANQITNSMVITLLIIIAVAILGLVQGVIIVLKARLTMPNSIPSNQRPGLLQILAVFSAAGAIGNYFNTQTIYQSLNPLDTNTTTIQLSGALIFTIGSVIITVAGFIAAAIAKRHEKMIQQKSNS